MNHWALSAAIWQSASYTQGETIWNNLVVTLGNIIGATFFMGMVYWYRGGMQTWLGQDKWRQPHSVYRDLTRALKDTITLMFAFTAIMPTYV